jgi:hypothetical protein
MNNHAAIPDDAILVACETALAAASRQSDMARQAFADWLRSNAPLHVSRHRAIQHYEDDPSDHHHTAYRAVWHALRAIEPATARLAVTRSEAASVHAMAQKAVDAIRRLRAASAEVATLGYDPKTLI